ncbi:hypothetical protein SAMN05444340_11913 [Citreimonas salinaria]|uniref:Uncharacterized protein n=1 Tax=Citreimonas salinaria TaxID=321339 RepID=A0A1H3MXG1_9RHOB|nr:hypothetical protein SAMN05444340_11913 [Citreimonas salinaria]
MGEFDTTGPHLPFASQRPLRCSFPGPAVRDPCSIHVAAHVENADLPAAQFYPTCELSGRKGSKRGKG